jgi:hypothetical protein
LISNVSVCGTRGCLSRSDDATAIVGGGRISPGTSGGKRRWMTVYFSIGVWTSLAMVVFEFAAARS